MSDFPPGVGSMLNALPRPFAAFTSDTRLYQIDTPLGRDALLVEHWGGREELSAAPRMPAPCTPTILGASGFATHGSRRTTATPAGCMSRNCMPVLAMARNSFRASDRKSSSSFSTTTSTARSSPARSTTGRARTIPAQTQISAVRAFERKE
jgi:hypothetical protein